MSTSVDMPHKPSKTVIILNHAARWPPRDWQSFPMEPLGCLDSPKFILSRLTLLIFSRPLSLINEVLNKSPQRSGAFGESALASPYCPGHQLFVSVVEDGICHKLLNRDMSPSSTSSRTTPNWVKIALFLPRFKVLRASFLPRFQVTRNGIGLEGTSAKQ